MPRPSSSAKRQQGAANQRDTRHEGGLVGPGKRISRAARNQQQNQLHAQSQQPQSQAHPQGQVLAQQPQPQPQPHPHLSDGSPRPAADDADITNRKNAAHSSTNSTNSRSSSIQPAGAVPATSVGNGTARAHEDMAGESRNGEAVRRSSLGAGSVNSSTESLPGNSEENHRQIDINAAKNANVHRDPGPIDFALTVLRTCPLYDTIAILIILMQLSPVALSSIYMLFTLLTFVPPVHTSSGLSLTEIFEGTLGTPSLTTLVCMDVVVLLVWLFLWGPLQLLILDFAQIVIALTLGGGATSSRSSGNNIFLCLGMVLFSHFARYPALQKVSRLASLVGLEGYLSPDTDDPLEPAIRSFGKRGAYSWVRNVFAIHILTQGVVRYIREWYLRREKRDLLSQGLADPEAGKSPFAGEMAEGGFATPDLDGAQTSTGGTSTKRKKRQSAQVRIRQPLWAALASTKIVMVKEYELSHAASESLGAEATDVDNLGNAPFYTQPGQIWICYVGFDEVCFNTSGFPDHEQHENGHTAGASYIDTSKPFFVRVNNAVWQPTRILPVEDGEGDQEGEDGPPGTRWTGDIYGLTPSSNYEVEFVCTTTGDVLFSTSVRTTQAPSKDPEAPAPKPETTAQPRRRHESPATTIKASIATQEAKLAEEKSKLKTIRKENNRKVNALKKEIDKLSAAVLSSGGNDEKLRQKITQNTVQQKQAEQSLSELDEELKELQSLPDGLVAQHRAKQSQWNAEKAQFDGARASFKSFKHGIDRELKTLEEEQSSLQAKRNKIAARIAKADSDHERITDANAKGLDEAERRRQERSAYEAEAGRLEQGFMQRIADVRGANEQKVQAVNSLTEMMRQYLASFDAEVPYDDGSSYPPGYPPTSGPSQSSIPWAPAPTSLQAYPQAMWPPTSGPSTVGGLLTSGAPPSLLPHPTSHIDAPPRIKPRHRSSSMLSDVSGFTQSSNGDDDMMPHNPNHYNPNAPSFSSPATHYAQHGYHAQHFMPPLQTNQAIPIRSPPGFTFARARGSSGSAGSSMGMGSARASGSGSSVRSGSGSGSGSVRDPTSPVM